MILTPHQTQFEPDLQRRKLLADSACVGIASLLVPGLATASSKGLTKAPHLPTQALLDIQRADQRFRVDLSTKQGYQIAAWLLRDIKANNQMAWPSMSLLLWASHLQQALAQMHSYTVFEITSGLRTQATNQSTEGAARYSRHLPDQYNRFYAMDIKPLGGSLDLLEGIAVQNSMGGIGRYETHLHLDVRKQAARW